MNTDYRPRCEHCGDLLKWSRYQGKYLHAGTNRARCTHRTTEAKLKEKA